MKPLLTRPRAIGVVASLLAALSLAACSSGSAPGSADSAASGDCKPAGKRVTLQYWNWVPGIQKVIDVWNKENPNIQVTVKDISNDSSGQINNALKAGQAPEVAQVTYDALPTMRMQDALMDMSACKDLAGAKNDFVDWTWSQATFNGDGVYAIPQDTGAEAMYYRADLFAKYKIPVPKTWDEYKNAAIALKKADPNLYITTFDPSDTTAFNGLIWQNSATMYSYQDDKWKVSIDSPQATQVADYWQGLIDQKLVRTDMKFGSTPMWDSYAHNQLATLVTAGWGYSMLRDNLPKQTGQWRVAPMPQWKAGESKAGNWGGSTVAFLKGNKYPYESAKFVLWLNSNPEAVALLNQVGGLYPASVKGLDMPSLQKGIPFYGDQKIFDVFKDASKNVDTSFQWGPVQTDANAAMQDAMADITTGKGTIADALKAAQDAAIKAMKAKSIPVDDN